MATNPLITAISTDFAAATITSTTAATNFAAINALDFLNLRQIFKGTGDVAVERVVLDFGATRTLKALPIFNINTAAITIAGDDDADWGSPSYVDTGFVAAQDKRDGLYKAWIDLTGTSFESTGYRYLSIISTLGSTTDGSGVLRLGGVLPLKSYSAWAKNPNPPYGATAEDAMRRRERPDGGAQYAQLGPVHADHTFELRTMVAAQDDDHWELQRYGRGSPVCWFWNRGNVEEVYVGYRDFTQRTDEYGGQRRSSQPMVLRSVV